MADKILKIKDIRERTPEELDQREAESRKEMFDMRTQALMEQLEDTTSMKKRRKEIARIHTVRREREIAAAAKETTENKD